MAEPSLSFLDHNDLVRYSASPSVRSDGAVRREPPPPVAGCDSASSAPFFFSRGSPPEPWFSWGSTLDPSVLDRLPFFEKSLKWWNFHCAVMSA